MRKIVCVVLLSIALVGCHAKPKIGISQIAQTGQRVYSWSEFPLGYDKGHVIYSGSVGNTLQLTEVNCGRYTCSDRPLLFDLSKGREISAGGARLRVLGFNGNDLAFEIISARE